MDLLRADELAANLADLPLGKTELLLQILDAEGEVLSLTGNEEDEERGLLDLLGQQGLQGPILELGHPLEDLDLADAVQALAPSALVEVSGGEDDEVTAVLGQELDSFEVVLLDQLPEVLVEDLLLDAELVEGEVGDLLQHGGDKVDAVEGLDADVEVGRHESLLLLNLLLESLVLLAQVVADTLGQAFLEVGALADGDEHVVALLKHAESEGSQSDLDDGPVVVDLVDNLLLLDDQGELGLEGEVLGLEELVVDGQVVKLHADGLDSELLLAVLEDHVHQALNDLFRRLLRDVDLLKQGGLILQALLRPLVE
mmetsp:Transcript_6471/g.10980  ORF Transcript_6471/g.10980 Transcript_6471/m.10980 type:complete len:313 (+) Transcript_6471:297-1235(+)